MELSFLLMPALHLLVVAVAAGIVSIKVRGTARALLWSAVGVLALGLLVTVTQFSIIVFWGTPAQAALLGVVGSVVGVIAEVLLILAVGAGRANELAGGAPLGPAQGFPQVGLPDQPTMPSYGPPPTDARPYQGPQTGPGQPY